MPSSLAFRTPLTVVGAPNQPSIGNLGYLTTVSYPGIPLNYVRRPPEITLLLEILLYRRL